MGAGMSVERSVSLGNMDMKSKFSQDVRKITYAAAKLKINSKRSKAEKTTTLRNNQLAEQQQIEELKKTEKQVERLPSKKEILPSKPKSISDTSSTVLVRTERRWTLTDLLHCMGNYVNNQCKSLLSRPTAPEVAMWVRCADKGLQLNGWTINSFLLESHIVFTHTLLQLAFERFTVRTLTDAKELVLMCLYISYTYNANEISYPLRPFLVKQDRVSFWNKCTELSLAASRHMLMLNRDRSYYKEQLSQLKSLNISCTQH